MDCSLFSTVKIPHTDFSVIPLQNSFWTSVRGEANYYKIDDDGINLESTNHYHVNCRLQEVLQNGIRLMSSSYSLDVYDGEQLLHSFGKDFGIYVPGFHTLNQTELIFFDHKRSIFNQKGVKIFELPFDREKRKILYAPYDYRLLLCKVEKHVCTQCDIFDTRFMSNPIYSTNMTLSTIRLAPDGVVFVNNRLMHYIPWNLNHTTSTPFTDKISTVKFSNEFMDVFTCDANRWFSRSRYKT